MSNTVWFITGSSRGLGRKIAQAALANGDKVAATARDTAKLAELAAAYPEQILTLPLDVTDEAQIEAAVAAAHAKFGRLDVVVNNAGYANLSAVEDTPLSDFRAQIDTNLLGVIAVVKAVLPILREQGQGRIINVSSVGSRLGTPGLAPYQAAKWAVSGFTEVLALEVAPLGVKVTAIEPGGMPTDWAGSSMRIPTPSEPYQAAIGAIGGFFRSGLTPLADLGKVAQAVLSVASLDEPPVRLLIGSDAIAAAGGYATALAASDAKWAELTRSTDRDDAVEADRDPLGQGAAGQINL
ncbi:MAG: SDR family NAD(P)-dependent oxidoreductase [Propionibacteriaceae bacterium]|jgi:NAD(P)-dependent dehydrogenase (short-subunit alcohol dehydrogenase family)|nr:SDR family NAD(P)-dependent oxidoreductase [Propionibacteriaceae bacterium]